MKRILLSAFACNPSKGSEMAYGWNWATQLALQGFEVHCFTRAIHKQDIERFQKPDGLTFHFLSLPFGLERLYSASQATMYLHYLIWQWLVYLKGKKLHKNKPFDIVHHVSWGSMQLGSFAYKIGAPFIIGPMGGGQHAPEAFKEYFGSFWDVELKRKKTSDFLVQYNPGCRPALKSAKAVLVSNKDTWDLAKKAGAENLFTELDAALPSSFFPSDFKPKNPEPGKLKLLWVGRFLPRKGLTLVLEVMKELKAYPDIKLTIVGDGEMMPIVKQLIKKFALEHTVTLTGSVKYDQVREFYASHDVFLFSSLRDSCPLQLIEAMTFGMPIVTINLHGQAAIVSDKTGFRCPCDTPEIAIRSMKESLVLLYNHPEKVNQMSHEARAFALNQMWENKIKYIVEQHY